MGAEEVVPAQLSRALVRYFQEGSAVKAIKEGSVDITRANRTSSTGNTNNRSTDARTQKTLISRDFISTSKSSIAIPNESMRARPEVRSSTEGTCSTAIPRLCRRSTMRLLHCEGGNKEEPDQWIPQVQIVSGVVE